MAKDTLETFLDDMKELADYMLPVVYTEENMELVRRAAASTPVFLRLADTALKLAENGSLERLAVIMEKMTDPRVLGLVEGTLDAVSQVDAERPPKVGLVGAVKELRDEDVQKSLGILLSIAKKMPAAVEKQ
jgi:uncharacterized protein YjgD (DUF1641 family)